MNDDPSAFEALFQQAPCGYLTTDADGRVTRVNDTFLHWSGHRREDLLGSAFNRLLPVGDRILWSTHSAPQLSTTGTVSEVVVEIVGADRVRRPALVTATRAPVTDGVPDEVRVVVFSAPERRAHERELVAALHRAEESDDRRAAAETESRRRALQDPLTGLPNRAGLSVHLESATGTSVGVLVVDLDHFAVVNESLGVAAGDELLLTVAERLCAVVREGAVVARSSADEFVVVDRCEDLDAARALAERLLEELTAPVVLAGLEVVTSASIGAALAAPEPGHADRALHDAGVAMQRAKARGRQRVEVHDPRTDDGAADRLRLLGELRRGIPDGQLRLHHQPQVRVHDGRISGVEALVRWQHPVRGLLPPSEFIDLAEQSGLVRELGAWVLDAAVEQAARWARDPECATVEVAVNLSTRQLTDPGLVDAVTGALARHRLAAHLLVLEVTETALAVDPDAAAATLATLKDLGVGVSVDDFGTGYASLTYLQRFPVDELKIDRSFVTGLGVNASDTAIVQACVQLARAVGVRTVAEGVETEEQRRLLAEMGCDVVQGYLFSRPVEAAAFQEWARAR
ncbi:putative bifunctional diguanylate cyclase/phosphodiesterase [Kineococcus radiotolerans]|uniref:Diguanylate cyclase/phosphodiesterase with PAS/PAC sensor(S) n=1 Tax=Kineococcus radiotolerans (strain ATCC BAA-149 / DSM 14245 / SRS30216) TaxID=266940 RepID=A6WG88_KINRD|nr:GGDEF domain-containing phosphodiesterase [Kineococcus radiotolerans]ABS05827.1 diguanylate cyclase/phosphodiesterase with PAS/PAC sensor(s) [Kineococcus radiotolerans SRS30216 = ATCC BAA-149]